MIRKIKNIFLLMIFLVFIIILFLNTKNTNFRNVKIEDFNKVHTIYTDETNLKKILKIAKIKLRSNDLITPELNKPFLISQSKVQIYRVDTFYKSKIIPINQNTIYAKTRALPVGQKLLINPGSKGYREETYKYLYMNGRKVKEERIDIKIICKPRDKVILNGVSEKFNAFKKENLPSGKVLNLHATAYSPAALSCAPFDDGFTAIGLRADYGVVAVDPKFIPLGTLLYIETYGYAIAGDVGSAINKNDVDLCFKNSTIAFEYGVKDIKAYIID